MALHVRIDAIELLNMLDARGYVIEITHDKEKDVKYAVFKGNPPNSKDDKYFYSSDWKDDAIRKDLAYKLLKYSGYRAVARLTK